MSTKPVELLAVHGLEKTSPGFRAELVRMAGRLGLNPSYIAAVISLESGFDPRAVNPITKNHVGLIQFDCKPGSTAERLGTSKAALLAMNATEQLKYVERFFRNAGPARLRNAGDYYMATFLPKFVGQPKSFVLARRGEKIYDQNKGLDRDLSGELTVGDVTLTVETHVQRAEARPRILVDPLSQATPTTAPAEVSSGSSSSPASPGSLTDTSETDPALPPVTMREELDQLHAKVGELEQRLATLGG